MVGWLVGTGHSQALCCVQCNHGVVGWLVGGGVVQATVRCYAAVQCNHGVVGWLVGWLVVWYRPQSGAMLCTV